MEFVLEPTPEAVVFWTITLLWTTRRWLGDSRVSRQRSQDGRLEFALILAAMILAFALCATSHHLDNGVVSGQAGVLVRWMGLLLYGGGVGLRLWAARSLGRFFTRDLEVRPDHQLVSSGPYALVQHPLYLALLMITVGLGLLFQTPVAALLGGAMVTAALLPRIRREERLLEGQLGSAYRSWARRRYRFLPPLV